jgi:hypothetical protein
MKFEKRTYLTPKNWAFGAHITVAKTRFELWFYFAGRTLQIRVIWRI